MKKFLSIGCIFFTFQTSFAGDSTGRYIYLNSTPKRYGSSWFEAGLGMASGNNPQLRWNFGLLYKGLTGVSFTFPSAGTKMDSSDIINATQFHRFHRLVAVSAGPVYEIKLLKKFLISGQIEFGIGHDLLSNTETIISDTGSLFNGTPLSHTSKVAITRSLFAGVKLGLFLNYKILPHTQLGAGISWIDGIYWGRQTTINFDASVNHGLYATEISQKSAFRFTNFSNPGYYNSPVFVFQLKSFF